MLLDKVFWWPVFSYHIEQSVKCMIWKDIAYTNFILVICIPDEVVWRFRSGFIGFDDFTAVVCEAGWISLSDEGLPANAEVYVIISGPIVQRNDL